MSRFALGALALSLAACAGGADRPSSPRDASVSPDAGISDAEGLDAAGPDGSVDGGAEPDAGAAGAWRPFADDSPWNTPIPESPALEATSDALIDALATSSQWPFLDVAIPQYSVPVYWVDDSTPLVTVNVTTVAGEGFHDDPRVPIPAGATPAAGTDRHLAIIHRTTGMEWDFWHASFTNGQWSCGVCAAIDTRSSGVRPHPQQGSPTWWRSHGSRACGFPLSAGLITVEQIESGHIDHALVIGYPGIRSRYYTEPASTAQATFPAISPDRGIPCGGRIQLDPDLDLSTLDLSVSGRIIARALQEYGAYVGDYNGSIALYADASPDARAAWGGGVLGVNELRNHFDLHALRVLQLGHLYDDGN